MNYKKITLALITSLLLCSTILNASAVIDEYNVAQIRDDYYDVYGQPNIIALISGDNTFERGDEGTLFITLQNDGEIYGLESNDDELDDDIADYGLDLTMQMAASEMNLDRQITTAKSMKAVLSLVDDDAPIEIKTDSLLLNSLQVGRSTTSPLAFSVQVFNNAKAGIYELKLDIAYTYQRDSAVTPPYGDMYFWDVEGNDTAILIIEIEEAPVFEVTGTTADLTAGETGEVEVIYKNTGDLTAYDCTARISTVDPFSTSDDQAYLGDLSPGESKSAIYKIEVDDAATVKSYAINSEVKYDDEHGDVQYSETLKAIVDVQPAVPLGDKVKNSPALMILLLVGIISTPVYIYVKRKK